MLPGSLTSPPFIAASTNAVSPTLRQIGPILSSVQQSGMAPVRGTRPKVGRSPVVPHRMDGATIEPSVSVPRLKATSPAAVAEPEPALDPLDPSARFQGLRVTPPYQMSP